MPAKSDKITPDFLEFIDSCPTSFHTADEILKRLRKAGFVTLEETDRWNLKPGGKYCLSRNGSAVAAFVIGSGDPAEGFLLAGAHTDSPGLKIKERSETFVSGAVRVAVELYGAPILSSWLDRDLSLAGRVAVTRKGGTEMVLVDLKRPVAVIPNLAIHLNREVNKGFEYNPQNHLGAVLGSAEKEEGVLNSLIAEAAGCRPDETGEGELFLYSAEGSRITGADSDLITSGRIDNLAGCHAIMETLSSAKKPERTVMGLFFDNEEVGSSTLQGAASSFLTDLLDRITLVRGGTEEDRYRARAASFCLSLDGAHAVHPGFADKHDPAYAPVLNGGPVIKLNAGFKYATTTPGAALFERLCEEADVPVQRFVMRSDLPCGSTIGPISSTLTGIPTVDVGIPMLGMHSIRETAGVNDQFFMIRILERYFKLS